MGKRRLGLWGILGIVGSVSGCSGDSGDLPAADGEAGIGRSALVDAGVLTGDRRPCPAP